MHIADFLVASYIYIYIYTSLVIIVTAAQLLSLRDLRKHAFQGSDIGEIFQRQVVLPTAEFSCNTSITELFFLAHTPMNAINLRENYPEFQVWELASDGSSYRKVAGAAALAFNCSRFFCQFTPSVPLPVESGQVLGLHQPSDKTSKVLVLFQKGSGPRSYQQTSNTPLTEVSTSSQVGFDYPLVAMETSMCC